MKQTGEHTVEAAVQGGDVHPYLIPIRFDVSGVTRASCSFVLAAPTYDRNDGGLSL